MKTSSKIGLVLFVSGISTSYAHVVISTNTIIEAQGDISYTQQNHTDLDDTVSSHGNTSATAVAKGGVLYVQSKNAFSYINNGDISFNDNYAQSEATAYYDYASASSYGGSICMEQGAFGMINNENVIFSGNYAQSGAHSVMMGESMVSYGGAVYSMGSITLVGNESVTFSGNYEKLASPQYTTSKSYRLRSIYMQPDSVGDNLTLSAKTGGYISFYDSVYMGYYSGVKVSLNADYEDADGVTQKAKGDIVFSGKYTEEHLEALKGKDGTSIEITNSRTSELLNTVNLYGGTLRVEDKAVLKTRAINVVSEGNATMKVSDAEVNASVYDITVNKTGTLEISGTDGSSKVTAKNIHIEEGATLSLTRTEVATENVAITLSSADSVSIYNDKIAGIVSSSNLNIAGGATLKADGAHLSMDGGILNFLATTENKTNLVLTLGAEYDPNSQIMLFSDVDTVKFLQDSITATSNSAMVTLNASDYFIGDWVNDKTILVCDKGNIYVSGVNVVIPEPATATLSLLALTALASRRRRK